MYEAEPIEIFWDNANELDASTIDALKKGGMRVRPIAVNQLTNGALDKETGPKVVCLREELALARAIFGVSEICSGLAYT